jgi:hypothetical protein
MKRRNNNIHIPFRIYIPPGGSQFSIPIKRHLLKDEYEFFFDYLYLQPDLYSKEAQVMDYDPESENEYEHSYPFQLEFNYDSKYYTTEGDANKYSQNTTTDLDISKTLVSINQFFESAKVVGQKYPPVIFDWGMATAIATGKDLNDHTGTGIYLLYHVKVDDPSLHDWLPPGSRMPGLNNWQFPITLSDPLVSPLIRIRMHLAPNVEIGFSNEKLLDAFGFSNKQYIPKPSSNAQIKFANPDPFKYLTIVGANPIGPMTPSTLNKISLYVHKKKVRSPEGVLITKRGHLTKPELLAQDYNKGFSEMAERCLHSLSLDYIPATKKFKFTYPTTRGLTTDIYLDPEPAEHIGYPRGTHKITQGTEPSTIENKIADMDIVKECRTIVFDVGLATVYHDDETDYQTQQFTDKVMTNLYPTIKGTMEMKSQYDNNPNTAHLSYFSLPQLKFTIKRYSEGSEPVSLSLPTGSYVIGNLVGQKV